MYPAIELIQLDVRMHRFLHHIDLSCTERLKVIAKDRPRQLRSLGIRHGTACIQSSARITFVGFVQCSLVYSDRVLSARSGHSRRWLGKYRPIGAQRPLTHRIWLRLSIASHGSEQTGPFPCICLKLWAQEICLVCTFQCPNIAMPRTTLGLCTASWPNLTIQALVGSPSYTHPS